MDTGKCKCANNVVKRDCSECEIGYYGLSSMGCKGIPPTFCPSFINCIIKNAPHVPMDKCATMKVFVSVLQIQLEDIVRPVLMIVGISTALLAAKLFLH